LGRRTFLLRLRGLSLSERSEEFLVFSTSQSQFLQVLLAELPEFFLMFSEIVVSHHRHTS